MQRCAGDARANHLAAGAIRGRGRQVVLRWLGQLLLIAAVVLFAIAVGLSAHLLSVFYMTRGAPRTALERDLRVYELSVEKAPSSVDAWCSYASAAGRWPRRRRSPRPG